MDRLRRARGEDGGRWPWFRLLWWLRRAAWVWRRRKPQQRQARPPGEWLRRAETVRAPRTRRAPRAAGRRTPGLPDRHARWHARGRAAADVPRVSARRAHALRRHAAAVAAAAPQCGNAASVRVRIAPEVQRRG